MSDTMTERMVSVPVEPYMGSPEMLAGMTQAIVKADVEFGHELSTYRYRTLAKAAFDTVFVGLTAAPVREEGGALKLGESDLFEVADIIRTARGVKHVGSKDYAVADEIVCFVNNHPRNSAAALATREEDGIEDGGRLFAEVPIGTAALYRDLENGIRPILATRDLLMERRHGSPARSPAHNARLCVEAMLTAAPVREEGGDWSAVRNVFVTYAGRFSQAARYEEASAIADMAAHDLAALATREEAPAEVGAVETLTAEDMRRARELREDPDSEDNERFASWYGDTLLKVHDAYLALRAQPQAREEAQPVGHFQFSKTWNAWEEVSPEYAGSDGVIPLFTTPPAPEAEKLRVAVEALKRIAGRKRHASLNEAEAWDIAAEALAALQQEGRPDA